MRKLGIQITALTILVTALVLTFAVTSATARDDNSHIVRARLSGFQETPSVLTTGHGEFRATINEKDSKIAYTLKYENLEGATTTQAHIHVGQRGVAGAVSAFLCGGAAGSNDKPACPPKSGTVTGIIDPADVIGPAGQGVDPGEFAELVRAIRVGVTYANVHTDKVPSGEIRGQLQADNRGDGGRQGDDD